MTILYGQKGQPVGSIEGDDLFSVTGAQIGFLEDGLILGAKDGGFMGSWVGGVIYNSDGAPQAFKAVCRKGVPLMASRLSPLPLRLASVGSDVSGEAPRPIPDFLRDFEPQSIFDGKF
ncbi:MAG: hypothetical protein V4461_12225 [Pseudomonadota bacterium]